MSTIYAVQFDAYGPFREAPKLRQIPKPTITKDTEVLIRVKASPIHPSDRFFIQGLYSPAKRFPSTAGYEGAGLIEEVGKGVKDLKVGQRVHFLELGTAWAEYAVLDTASTEVVIVPFPDSISFEKAAQFTVNPVTALTMLEELGVKKGEYVLQTAAASAVGRQLIQIAKAKGFKTINAVRQESQIEALKQLGADHVINGLTAEKVNAIVKGGVKYAVDPVGGATAAEVVKSLGDKGKVLLYGVLAREAFSPTLTDILFKRLTVEGFWMAPWLKENPDKAKVIYQELIELVASGVLTLDFKTFDGKTQLKEALEHSVETGKLEKTILL